MKKHVKIYLEYFGYRAGDFIPSEISGERADDIHHIECCGMGGSGDKDNVENLMALTRAEHEKYGDKVRYEEMLKIYHKVFMKRFGKIKRERV